MADCNETLTEIRNYFADQLSEETRAGVQEHLGGCTDCLQAFDFYAEFRTVVTRAVESKELPQDLLGKIQECFGSVFADGEGSQLRSES